MTLEEIETVSQDDKCLKRVRECLAKNKRSKQGDMKPYCLVRSELSVKHSVVLKGTKLVIPRNLQQRVFNLAHMRLIKG